MYHGERFNAITHLLGTILAIVALPVLVVTAARTGRALPVVTFSIYGATLVLLYLLSTLYHSFKGTPKQIFRKLDHLAIYVLIAGTYTPVALCTLGGSLGWGLCAMNWALAAIGIALEFIPSRRNRALSYLFYVVMGWSALIAIDRLLDVMTIAGNALIFGGGVLYTAGFGVYAWRSLPHHHGIWHLFVMGGSICHFLAILLYVR